MQRTALDLEPYRPDHLCPRCGSEGARPYYHRGPILVVFGDHPQRPCARESRDFGPHFCNRCENCGCTWMEAVIPGTDQARLE